MASDRRSLVAGGAGFIGSHLCERLLAEGGLVVCIDDFSTGSHENVAHLIGNPRFRLIEGDVTNPITEPADEIFNLASPASPLHYQRDPIRTMRVNVVGAMTLLDHAQACACPIFQASTSEVYGDPLTHPQTESDWGNVNPIGPRACYDEGKRAAEALCFDYHRMYGVDVRVARIFNTYGPRMDSADGRAIINFIGQALAGAPITIYGDGSQTRSFCFVDDMIDGVVAMMRRGPEARGPLNLGTTTEISINEIAELVIRLTGSSSKIVREPAAVDDPKRRRPDISLASRLLSWVPGTSLEDGLIKTIDHARLWANRAG